MHAQEINMKSRKCYWLLLIVLLAPALTNAGEKVFDKYTIHYNTFSSDFLTPQIAKAYGIQRSKNRAVLNITITENKAGSLPIPVEANIDSMATNEYQKLKDVKLRQIKENDAIYYISEFSIANQEIISFKIDANKDGKVIGTVKFQQQFFIDK